MVQRDRGIADVIGMASVPKKLVEKVQFYENHVAAFSVHAAAIGLTLGEAADLRAKAEAARAAFDAQQNAILAARSATAAFNDAVEVLGSAGAACLLKIRGQAESTGNVDVYTLASILPIAPRSPMAEPGSPSRLKTELDGTGALTLRWKCKNPKGSMGTIYQLLRSIAGGPFNYLATVGEKRFRDTTIPAHATAIEYEIRAIRSTKVGPGTRFPVSFGTNGFRQPVSYTPTQAKAMLAA